MKREHLKSLIVVGFLLIVTGVAMGDLNGNTFFRPANLPQNPTKIVSSGNGPVTFSAHLVQDKVFAGGDGTVSLSLTMQANEMLSSEENEAQHVDMVIVLDQSGSMQGQKMEYARQAVLNLLSGLSPNDRVALIGYANGVRKYTDLLNVTGANLEELQSIISSLSTGGHTNLGGGLQEGINTLLSSQKNGNMERVILISDGLANRGITGLEDLGEMASIAVNKEFGISTVGVGNDFNEQLMTAIADRGAGNYYYLSNPQAFAQVFLKEFQDTRTVVAHATELNIAIPEGVALIKASGFPITITGNQAVVHPGDLLAGQTRKLFLTLQVPTHLEKTYELAGLNLQYVHQETSYTTALSEPFQIACVNDPNEAVASIDTAEWEEKVIQEDFNALRENVALDLKKGKKKEAMEKIDDYYSQQEVLNDEVGSAKVTTHLENEVDELRDFVEQTFTGDRQDVEKQQKANAKSLQYEGYKERRAKK